MGQYLVKKRLIRIPPWQTPHDMAQFLSIHFGFRAHSPCFAHSKHLKLLCLKQLHVQLLLHNNTNSE
jgi:hypothetical protein